jgi:Protein of unknown function (DUF2934)
VKEKTQIESRLRIALDIETRRKKQQDLMVRLVERKVRSRAKQLYESRGQTEGQELQDWFQAESEIIANKTLARLYRRLLTTRSNSEQTDKAANETAAEPTPAYETGV